MGLGMVRAAMRTMKKLSLKEGDIVIVKVPHDPTGEIYGQVGDMMEEALEQLGVEKLGCLVVPEGFSFETADDELLAKMGLYRVDKPIEVNL
jgi:hypothetical protein